MRSVVLVSSLLLASCGGAQRTPAAPPPGSWVVCETFTQTTCGSFTWNPVAQSFEALWENAATSTLTLQRLDENRIALERTDNGGPFPGTRGSYSGQRIGDGFGGSVSITLPDGRSLSGTWEARGELPTDLPDGTAAQVQPPVAASAEGPATETGTGATAAIPSCALEAFLAFIGPDRHFSCPLMFTIEAVDRASCSVSGTQHLGPAIGFVRVMLNLGLPSAVPPTNPDEDALEVHTVTQQGAAFLLSGSRQPCTQLTQEEYDSALEEEDNIDTSGEDEF